ncbi:GntR family transcriptional regulator, partial [Micromonospora sp. NPDC057140]
LDLAAPTKGACGTKDSRFKSRKTVLWCRLAPILNPGQPVLRLERLRCAASGPVAWLVNYVRTDLAPGLEQADLADRSLFGLLENDYGLKITTGRRTFTATAATGRVAEALGVPEQFPLLYLEQITYLDDGRAIEYSDVWIHSERMRVTSLLSRR